ncbi:ribonuclease P [Malassezia equina]|uniref:Ribonuclease P n=1 Tax=Malassezia equina TaxID=1381935 RepID=A0AAF0EG08_9BASI|nr:ribonuclease P [Malassezia equina]
MADVRATAGVDADAEVGARAVWSSVAGDFGTDTHYEARVRGRNLVLGNANRRAPLPATPMLARQQAKARRRATRPQGTSHQRPKRARIYAQDTLTSAQMEPLQSLWTTYIQDVLRVRDMTRASAETQLQNAAWVQQVQSTLLKADWTGASIRVVRSTQPTLVHVHGMVLAETHETLQVLPPTSKPMRPHCMYEKLMKGIPKQNSVFRIDIPLQDGTLRMDVHGNQVRYTMPVRATRKHKAKKTIELS